MTSGRHNHSWRNLLPAPNESRLTRAWPRILLATLLSVAVTFIERGLKLQTYSLTTTPFTILGVAISFFLGFRNTTAYNRYWEARTLWGRIINTARSLGRQILTQTAPRGVLGGYGAEEDAPPPESPPIDAEEARELRVWQERTISLVIGYAHALRHHLLGSDPLSDLQARLQPEEIARLRGQDNVPMVLLSLLAERLRDARRRGWTARPDVMAIENSLTQLTDAQGGCERIRNTPIPLTYTLLSHRIVTIFCCALPFGLVDSVKLLTPCVVFLVSYAFIGLDVLGEEISDPFGSDPHDLPLASLTGTIEKNLLQLLQDANDHPLHSLRSGMQPAEWGERGV